MTFLPDSPEQPPRVAFCTDTFEEANGVATVSRAYVDFARRHRLPFLLIRPGAVSRTFADGQMTVVEVAKSGLSVPLDMGLRFDLLMYRQAEWLRKQLDAFHPDVVHITGPGDLGMVCARLSHTLRVPKPPLVAAWHTNVHQYARMRSATWLPKALEKPIGEKIEAIAFRLAARFYQSARLILAPNQEMVDQLARTTGKPSRLMLHGVDADLFSPPRERAQSDAVTLGYAGRLTSEKNVRFLAHVAANLPSNVRFLIVGDGAQRPWLERCLPSNAVFTGMLRGEQLASAYRQMDVFLFPSLSDTFGLVVLEAMATGVPVVSFQVNGPKSVVENYGNGVSATTNAEFIAGAQRLVLDNDLRIRLGQAARKTALRHSWEEVFSSVYDGYRALLPATQAQPALVSAAI